MFSIGILGSIDLNSVKTQAMVLSNTRELAQQTQQVIYAIGYKLNVEVHACVGGKKIGHDLKKLEGGVHVVSGTPGRVYDLIKRVGCFVWLILENIAY